MSEVTLLLDASRRGEPDAVRRLFDLLYQDLRQLAHSKLSRNGQLTLLDTTALVHESYLKLLRSNSIEATNKGHFMGFAAHVMRSIVIDFVRRRSAERRGGEAAHLPLEAAAALADPREREILEVHEALEELAKIDARLVNVVEMRYFAGMSEAEVAEALGRSLRSVARDWEKAKLFLSSELSK